MKYILQCEIHLQLIKEETTYNEKSLSEQYT